MATLHVQQSAKESLASPSPSLLPSLGSLSPLSITHLHGFQSYLSDWRADRRHAHRPQPPTPARMASESRRLSTAIPHPSSGTSRRLTSGQRQAGPPTLPLLSPEKARRPPQPKPSDQRSGSSSLAYHFPRSLIPRSESLLAGLHTGRQFEPELKSPRVQHRGLSKSQTTPALLSPNKDIASHSLLRPLEPPLPRSSTLNDVSVLQSPSSSPKKIRTDGFKISFEDSITTKKSDVQVNRTKSPYPHRTAPSRPRIAETLIRTLVIPPFTTDGNATSVIEGIASCNIDSRFVYTYEIPAYWVGRYVALMDRLRARTFAPSQSPGKVNQRREFTSRRGPRPKTSMDFARIEIDIEKETMSILRSFCQTMAATESFERFEFLLRKNHVESFRRQELSQIRLAGNRDGNMKTVPNNQPVPVANLKPERQLLSGTIPQRMFRKTSSTVAEPKLEKSATIANFSDTGFFISSSPEDPDHETRLLRQAGRAVTLQQQIDCRRTLRTLPRPKIGYSRTTLRTPSNDKVNTEESRTVSHRDVKQMITLVDGGSSSSIPSGSRPMAPTTWPQPSDPDDVTTDSSRRSRKSESIKQFVDFGIREVRKMSMGRRRATSGTISGINAD